jgi:two-component system sensor histidine kinase RegB
LVARRRWPKNKAARNPRQDMNRSELPLTVTLRWLVRLRWVAAVGQLAMALLAVVGLHLALPLGGVLGLVAATAISNGALAWRLRRGRAPSEPGVAGILLVDVALLTALLALTGGPNNPFSALYLVHVTLAAVVLGPRWAWPLVAFAMAGYGALFFVPGAPGPHDHHLHGGYPYHLQGMWVAFAVAACVITYFVTRIGTELRAREAELATLRDRAARTDKLAALSTLAAGAAHELGTPLSTIALVARELEHTLEREAAAAAMRDDARLIRTEVERCRGILQQLSADAGESMGEAPVPVTADDLSRRLQTSLSASEAARVQVEVEPGTVPLRLPQTALTQALRSLVRNALEAGPGAVRVRLAPAERALRLQVEDQAGGMPPEVLARAGEPFFTTKPPGRGMGLGIFLARAVAERLGGSLTLRSSPGLGTTATLELPGAPP